LKYFGGDMIDFIGPISLKRNNIGGATLKNRYLIEELKKNSIEIKALDTDNWKKNYLKIILKLTYIFIFSKSRKIILSTSSRGTYIFLKLAYYLNIKNKKIYYFVVGGDTPEKLSTRQYDIKYYKNLNKIYSETISMCKRLKSLGLKQTEYLPNFKDFNLVKINKKKIELPLKCIFFSRVIPEKGTEMIFKALNIINEEVESMNVDFYGPICNEYKELFLKKIDNQKAASYKGILNIQDMETFKILSEYDLMLFPTYWKGEGFPGTLIDSFIAGVPVLASDWNYNKEILNDKTGFIFESKNQKKFEKIIKETLKSPEILNEKRKNCLIEAEKFHVKSVLINVVKELKNDSTKVI